MKKESIKPGSPAFPNGKRRPAYPRFDGYTGGKVWCVTHPEFGSCFVIAPSNPAAIVVAARYWKQTWTEIRFYADCKVQFKGDRKTLTQPGSAVMG